MGFREQFPLEMVICFVLSGVQIGCFDGGGSVYGLSYFGSLMPCDGIRISLLILSGVVLVLDVHYMSGAHHIWRVILGLLYYGQLLHRNSLSCVVHVRQVAAPQLSDAHTHIYCSI